MSATQPIEEANYYVPSAAIYAYASIAKNAARAPRRVTVGMATLLPALGLVEALALPDAAVPLALPEPEPEPDEVVALPPLHETCP